MDWNATPRPYWMDRAPPPDLPPLESDVYVDVAVVGGGLVGLTCAYLLKRAGYTVAVVEAGRLGALTSGANTGKVTVQHGLLYAPLEQKLGPEAAWLYAEANQTALQHIERVQAEEGIACDFERVPAYLCAPAGDAADALTAEHAAARRAGLPVTLLPGAPLPVPIRAALRLDGQAQFHPRKYLLGLARLIPGGGCHVFERSRVLRVEDGQPGRLVLGRGSVTAGDIVLATHLPLGERGGLFLKAFPRRHVALAARLDPAASEALMTDEARGMFLSVESPGWSLRIHREGDTVSLIAVGEGFKTGHGEPRARLERLARFVEAHFPVQAITHWWGAQDFHSADGVPYVGRLGPREHVYAATGFGGWGLTGGTAAALMITDAIRDRPNPWAALFDATRVNARVAARDLLRENLDATREWLGGRLTRRPPRSPEELAPDAGALMRVAGETCAVYRDAQGALHVLSPVCPHLGCYVTWNGLERSWDCPCHGSRFDARGAVLEGPAVQGLRPRTASGGRRGASEDPGEADAERTP
ncbi:FAD-dependent oxidoreductase [Ectothiorhodospiraceae bacterium 2226]|nr:FAD-dependent oxidoreductase [Ectothiorhodospiraceae bacterium 2226]